MQHVQLLSSLRVPPPHPENHQTHRPQRLFLTPPTPFPTSLHLPSFPMPFNSSCSLHPLSPTVQRTTDKWALGILPSDNRALRPPLKLSGCKWGEIGMEWALAAQPPRQRRPRPMADHCQTASAGQGRWLTTVRPRCQTASIRLIFELMPL